MTQKTIVIAIAATDVQDSFSIALAETGHRTVAVKHLSELLAFLQLQTAGIDLVVLDVRLPLNEREDNNDESIQIVRIIRRVAPQVPIIVFSGSICSAAQVKELADLGVVRYINEYISIQDILPSLVPVLSPDSFDRRTSSRVTIEAPASLRNGDTISSVLILNLSKGGMAIRSMNFLSAGTQVIVRFRLPESNGDVEAVSRVVWSSRKAGLGLQFEEIKISDQSAINEFVDIRLG
jgi:CheY-like chemotaxis protein